MVMHLNQIIIIKTENIFQHKWLSKPVITVLDNVTTEVVPINIDIYDSSLPADIIVRAEKYVSGTQLDEVAALIHNTVGGETKAVYDIDLNP